MLDSDFTVRGKSHAVEALKAMLQYGFIHLFLERIIFRTLEQNLQMRTLLQQHFTFVPEYHQVEAGTECVFTVLKQDRHN